MKSYVENVGTNYQELIGVAIKMKSMWLLEWWNMNEDELIKNNSEYHYLNGQWYRYVSGFNGEWTN